VSHGNHGDFSCSPILGLKVNLLLSNRNSCSSKYNTRSKKQLLQRWCMSLKATYTLASFNAHAFRLSQNCRKKQFAALSWSNHATDAVGFLKDIDILGLLKLMGGHAKLWAALKVNQLMMGTWVDLNMRRNHSFRCTTFQTTWKCQWKQIYAAINVIGSSPLSVSALCLIIFTRKAYEKLKCRIFL